MGNSRRRLASPQPWKPLQHVWYGKRGGEELCGVRKLLVCTSAPSFRRDRDGDADPCRILMSPCAALHSSAPLGSPLLSVLAAASCERISSHCRDLTSSSSSSSSSSASSYYFYHPSSTAASTSRVGNSSSAAHPQVQGKHQSGRRGN